MDSTRSLAAGQVDQLAALVAQCGRACAMALAPPRRPALGSIRPLAGSDRPSILGAAIVRWNDQRVARSGRPAATEFAPGRNPARALLGGRRGRGERSAVSATAALVSTIRAGSGRRRSADLHQR